MVYFSALAAELGYLGLSGRMGITARSPLPGNVTKSYYGIFKHTQMCILKNEIFIGKSVHSLRETVVF